MTPNLVKSDVYVASNIGQAAWLIASRPDAYRGSRLSSQGLAVEFLFDARCGETEELARRFFAPDASCHPRRLLRAMSLVKGEIHMRRTKSEGEER